MKLKDIIKITILAAIAFVLEMVGSYASYLFGPYFLFVNHAIASLLAGSIYFVLCHKVPRRGTVFLYYLIIGLVYTVMGFWPMVIINVIAGLLGEAVIGSVANFENNRRIGLSYVVAQTFAAMHGLIFFLVLRTDGMIKLFPDMFTPEVAQQIADFYGKGLNIFIVLAIQIIAAIIGAAIGYSIYKKFFHKQADRRSLLD